MPRPTLLAAALPVLLCALFCPTTAQADSSRALTERYIARTFRAMAEAARDATTEAEAAAALRPLLRSDIAVDETARYVLGRDWPDENTAAAARFREQFLHFVSNALASAFRTHPPVELRVDGSHVSDGRIQVQSALLVGGRAWPLTWIVRREGPKGRRRIENFRLAGIDAQMMLREVAATALERNPGNLEAVIAVFNQIAARASAPERRAAEAGDAQRGETVPAP